MKRVYVFLVVEKHLRLVRQEESYYAMQRESIVVISDSSDLSKEVILKFLSV